MFKFNFNDQVNLKADYKFKGTLLFIAKIDRSKLLKAVSYPEFSREKGFYFTKRDLPFPQILLNQSWEDESYIKGSRKEETITVYNLNLTEGIVFGVNEPYKIVPYKKVESSKFSSIFSAYSKSMLGIEEKLYDIDFSFNTLSHEDYLKYTSIGKKDPLIEDFILKYKDYYNNPKDFLIFFYQLFKKNYFYSISTFQKEGYEGIISFLFKTKKGYCAHFASAYALLLRYYGIPVRVVGGFKAIEDNKILDYYRFYDFNAHSWVEVYTDEYGWVPIDPTSDKIAEDEMLPFEKPLEQDESSLLEEILKIEKNLTPFENKIETKKNEEKKELKVSSNYFLYLLLILVFIPIFYLTRLEILLFISFFLPKLIYKSLKIYIFNINRLLKKEFISGENLKIFFDKNIDFAGDKTFIYEFATIYNNLMFAPPEVKNIYINKKYCLKLYSCYKKIIHTIKKSKKGYNLTNSW